MGCVANMLLKGLGTAVDSLEDGLKVGQVVTGRYGEKYRLVQFDTGDGPVTVTPGAPVGVFDQALGKVTPDFSESKGSWLAGIACCTATDGQYGWILCEGRIDDGYNGIDGGFTLITDGSAVAGAMLRWTGDKAFTTVTISSNNWSDDAVGVQALADDSTNDLTSAFVRGFMF